MAVLGKTYDWSLGSIEAPARTEAWRQVLCASYRDWDVSGRVPDDFSARVRRVDLAGASLVECVCSPCYGRRDRSLLRRDDEPYIGIQIVRSGKERFRVGDAVVSVQAGDTLVWVSDREMEFEVTEQLHKITFMMPLETLRSRLPAGAHLRNGVLDGHRGMGAMMFSHLAALCSEVSDLDAGELGAARRATLELASAVLVEPLNCLSRGLSQQYLENIQNYVLANLHDEDLSPKSIARANRISVRYLHLLFAATGVSISSWITEMRLQHCREMLEDPAFNGCKLADVAQRWGFKEASRFSRAFKARFGISPSQIRKTET